MLRSFYPRKQYKSVYDIPFEKWQARGMTGVIFDIDNTLVPHGAPADDRALCLFERLRALGMETVLLSNNKEMRVASFAAAVNSRYICRADKPSAKNYIRAMEWMGTGRQTTMFVGDQLFTDIYGANRAGMISVLVEPIHPKEEIQIVIKRRLEAVVLYFYRRQKRKGEREHD